MSGRVSDLPPFDAAGLCPKCGHDDVSTVYRKDAHCSHYPDYCVLSKLTEPACCKAEHFHRSCQRCRYWWAERVLESPPRRAAEGSESQVATGLPADGERSAPSVVSDPTRVVDLMEALEQSLADAKRAIPTEQ